MTNKEIFEMYVGFNDIKKSGMTFPEKVNYARKRNEKILKPLVELYEESSEAIAKKYGETDSKDATKVIVPVTKIDQFKKEQKELDNLEVFDESELFMISEKQLKDLNDGELPPKVYDGFFSFTNFKKEVDD